MEQQQIVENNRLIEEFRSPTNPNSITPKGFERLIPDYHNDWNCLMSIIGKISRLHVSDFKTITSWELDYEKRGVCGLPLSTPIFRVHALVIAFINWYNQQEKL